MALTVPKELKIGMVRNRLDNHVENFWKTWSKQFLPLRTKLENEVNDISVSEARILKLMIKNVKTWNKTYKKSMWNPYDLRDLKLVTFIKTTEAIGGKFAKDYKKILLQISNILDSDSLRKESDEVRLATYTVIYVIAFLPLILFTLMFNMWSQAYRTYETVEAMHKDLSLTVFVEGGHKGVDLVGRGLLQEFYNILFMTMADTNFDNIQNKLTTLSIAKLRVSTRSLIDYVAYISIPVE
jgi:hypothetical protein